MVLRCGVKHYVNVGLYSLLYNYIYTYQWGVGLYSFFNGHDLKNNDYCILCLVMFEYMCYFTCYFFKNCLLVYFVDRPTYKPACLLINRGYIESP